MDECVVRMEMPMDCLYCPMVHFDAIGNLQGCEAKPGKRYLQGKKDEFWNSGRPSWCPILCSLPEGHGDLVDWKDVEKELDRLFCNVVEDVSCMGPYMLKRKEYPQTLIERPIRVNIIVPAERK